MMIFIFSALPLSINHFSHNAALAPEFNQAPSVCVREHVMKRCSVTFFITQNTHYCQNTASLY